MEIKLELSNEKGIVLVKDYAFKSETLQHLIDVEEIVFLTDFAKDSMFYPNQYTLLGAVT